MKNLEQTKNLEQMIITALYKRADRLSLPQLKQLSLSLSLEQEKDKTWLKKDWVRTIKESTTTVEQIASWKKSGVGFEIEVKDILTHEISVDEIISTGICLPLSKMWEDHPSLAGKFKNTCDVIQKNDVITSVNCEHQETQGLYILTIHKKEVDYIVKIGSFAETQGMAKRIGSFGGGCYETGSATNKWFQRFIKKAIEQGFTSRFTYYNHSSQQPIETIDLDDQSVKLMPFVMRPLESQLFQMYNQSNDNVPPIFGSNCT